MSQLIDAERSYNFWPYAYTSRGVTPNLFYAHSSEEISLVHCEDVSIGAYFLLSVIAPTLIPSKLENDRSMVSYSPQQILQQFGFDQEEVWVIEDGCVSVWEAESLFIGDDRDNILARYTSIYWPSQGRRACDHRGTRYSG